MAIVFISHSSKDKNFAKWLSESLVDLGHEPWLDEWDIKIGDSITEKIQKGLEDCDVLVLLLSQHSVSSSWVTNEWKAKYWDEINQKKTIILPALIECCDVPTLLKDKKYADFRTNRTKALFELVTAFPSVSKEKATGVSIDQIVKVKSDEALELIKKLSNQDIRLSETLSDILKFAKEKNDDALIRIAKYEIIGWRKETHTNEELAYRAIEAYATFGEINPYSFAWGGDLGNAISYLKNDKNVKPFMLLLDYEVAFFEQEMSKFNDKSVACLKMKGSDFGSKDAADRVVNIYMANDCYRRILGEIRRHLTEMLFKYV